MNQENSALQKGSNQNVEPPPIGHTEWAGGVTVDDAAFKAKVSRRRWAVGLVTLGISLIGVWLLSDLFSAGGWTVLRAASFGLFALLFSTLAFGFTQAFLGFLVLAEGHEPLKISNTLSDDTPLASTAVVMPVYNEPAETVFGNIFSLYQSLRERGELEHFEFYVLSDSTDPAKIVEEELAWADLCRQTGAFGKIHYRRRKMPVNRKSGNIADFCRRWGHRHRYMVVLDADSIMSGQAVASLVRIMERNPKTGIVQTMPRLAKAETLFGRIQQFASRLYSPIFAAGLNFWQQDAGNYWGHNAIIRLSPFLKNCALPELPGSEPLGGRILSHDFVEAALMRNAGWEVWFAYDLEGSYEGLPPNLTEYVKRDRRWCQGNLQHVWFLLANQIRPISRLHLVQGILTYGAAPLLVVFIALGALQSVLDRFHHHHGVFPAASAAVLFLLTLSLLFGPKLLSLIHIFSKPEEVKKFGGPTRMVAGTVAETLFSILSAPVMIWFHTRFVLRNIAGQNVTWNTQTRDGSQGPDWRDVIREYWPLVLGGFLFAGVAWWIAPGYFAWVLPLLVGLWFSIPLVQISGRVNLLKSLFQTPEETAPAQELHHEFQLQIRGGNQFLHAILDPYYNAVHVSLQREKENPIAATTGYLDGLAEKVIQEGGDSLTAREKRALLLDGAVMSRLHSRIWKTPSQLMHPSWKDAFAVYRTSPQSGVNMSYVKE
jgi:membrane glycosyltransferase